MTISKDDAARALGEIDQARGRLREATAYGQASPFFIVWGVVWLVADGLTQFAPGLFLAWPVCIVAGAIVSFLIGFRMGAKGAGEGWRQAVSWVATMGMTASLFLVIPVTSGREVHSIFGLVFGFIYIAIGVWIGWRIVALGAALIALTLFGFYAVREWYPLFMGVVAGGALILGGVWLRRL